MNGKSADGEYPRADHQVAMGAVIPDMTFDATPDEGSALGIASLLASEFCGDGPFSDAPAAAPLLAALKPGPARASHGSAGSSRATSSS